MGKAGKGQIWSGSHQWCHRNPPYHLQPAGRPLNRIMSTLVSGYRNESLSGIDSRLTQTLVSLWQFNHSRVCMTFRSCEGRNSRFCGSRCSEKKIIYCLCWFTYSSTIYAFRISGLPNLRVALYVNCLVYVFINFSDRVQELWLKHLLKSRQLCRGDLSAIFAFLKLFQELTRPFDIWDIISKFMIRYHGMNWIVIY